MRHGVPIRTSSGCSTRAACGGNETRGCLLAARPTPASQGRRFAERGGPGPLRREVGSPTYAVRMLRRLLAWLVRKPDVRPGDGVGVGLGGVIVVVPSEERVESVQQPSLNHQEPSHV